MKLAVPDGTQQTSDLNWNTLLLNMRSGTWSPAPVPSTNGPSSSGTLNYQAWYSTSLASHIQFNIQILVTGTLTWAAGKYINLPKVVSTISSSTAGTVQSAIFPVHNIGATTIAGYVEVAQQGSTAILINHGSTFTSTTNLSIQGFYFTGK